MGSAKEPGFLQRPELIEKKSGKKRKPDPYFFQSEQLMLLAFWKGKLILLTGKKKPHLVFLLSFAAISYHQLSSAEPFSNEASETDTFLERLQNPEKERKYWLEADSSETPVSDNYQNKQLTTSK